MITYVFKKTYYDIEVVLKFAYKDRYLLDKKKYYVNYFFSIFLPLLLDEPDFVTKSIIMLLNFEFYKKLSYQKLLTTTFSSNYIMHKLLRYDYYKRFLVLDFSYNSYINYSTYFNNNQVFYSDIVINILKQKLNQR